MILDAPPPPLVLMPCSGLKLAHVARADTLYTGVMWQTYRTHAQRPVCLAILSALHGFLAPANTLDPYEQRMTASRSDELTATASTQAQRVAQGLAGSQPREVLMVGGVLYRKVMCAVVSTLIEEGALHPTVQVLSTSGGIGVQRSQLGAWLRGEAPQLAILVL